jgi:hypothetical protein
MRCLVCRNIFPDSLRRCPKCAARDDELLPKLQAEQPGTSDERPQSAESPQSTASATLRETVGVVYLLQSGGYYKIGKSTKPDDRYARLAIQLPEPVKVVHEIETNDVDFLERHWHRHFHDKRLNGEWFALTDEDVEEFCKYRVLWVNWR